MPELKARDLITDNLELVSLPEIVVRLNEMINDPECSTADISQVISQDAALTARLLKIVNSPFYGFPSQVDTISMAITIVGTRQLRDLVMATAIVKKFNNIPASLVSPELFWRHNIACAAAARTLAMNLGFSNSERFFVAGLLHDIGKLVMYLTQPELSRQIITQAGQHDIALATLEKTTFGFDHAELGGELLRSWHLPESLVEPVACHHDMSCAQQYVKEAAVIHLANAIANRIEPVLSMDDEQAIDDRVWEILAINSDQMDKLTTEARYTMQHAVQVMFLDLAA